MNEFPKTKITMLSADSRKIKSGGLFLAVKGVEKDGNDFIDEAIKNGAKVIITSNLNIANIPKNIEVISSKKPRSLFAKVANNFYQPQPNFFAGITGTNGKTSIASFTAQLWQTFNKRAISVGTLGMLGCGYSPSSSLTTPDPADLHKNLQSAKLTKDVDNVCIEASSHGLDMSRLDGIKFNCAGFSNLSRDHLDYHLTMDKYFNAKAKLFSHLLPSGSLGVLNAGAREYETLKSICTTRKIKVLSYGFKNNINNIVPDICVLDYNVSQSGFDLELSIKGKKITTQLNLAGLFQLENCLCAIGLASADNLSLSSVAEKLPLLTGVKGRLEIISKTKSGAHIYVDFAHTPSALESVLKTMRAHTSTNLNVVIGCGGDRDSGKRPIMGKTASLYANKIYITDDNPRSEDPKKIRQQIIEGIKTNLDNVYNIGSRELAIKRAIEDLESGDILIVAGKGHEMGQIINHKTIPFNDGQVITCIVGEL